MVSHALEGIKVVDFGWAVVAPLTALVLAHHGATVIRIESRHRMDIARSSWVHKDDIPGPDRCANFTALNSAKYGMTLNLKHPKGVEIARRLVAWSDIVGENFAPGVMDKLGLGYNTLKKIKPELIMFSASNLGQTGPEAKQPGYGTMLVSYSGFSDLTGWPDRIPSQPQGAYTDYIAPRLLIPTLLAALDYRRRTHKGQYFDMSQMEAALQFMAPAIMDYTINSRILSRRGNSCDYAVPHGVYPCKGDDRWCAISVYSDKEWKALLGAMDNPEWAQDDKLNTLRGRKQQEDEIDRLLCQWTCNYTAEEVMEKLQKAGIAAGVVKNSADIQSDPQLNYRRYFSQLEHPEIGWQLYEGVAGYTMSETPAEIDKPAPLLGQHTEYVCRKILGMTDEEFISLYGEGTFD
jgi:benzylsuccinate CoA-transferase BbsF subunit